jgi:DNA-binding NarL/FixJ family response regulator
VVAMVHDGRSLIASTQSLKPDVIMVDIGMPELNGLKAAQRVKRILPSVKVIYVTVSQDPELVAEALKTGASGFVTKNSAGSELIIAIQTVLSGATYVTSELRRESEEFADTTLPERLPKIKSITERQLDVLQLLAEGKSMKQVAAELDVALRTVAFHKYRLMQRLQLKNDAEIVQYAVRHRIIFDQRTTH